MWDKHASITWAEFFERTIQSGGGEGVQDSRKKGVSERKNSMARGGDPMHPSKKKGNRTGEKLSYDGLEGNSRTASGRRRRQREPLERSA